MRMPNYPYTKFCSFKDNVKERPAQRVVPSSTTRSFGLRNTLFCLQNRAETAKGSLCL